MQLSTDVNLPKATKPAFPDRCVACGRPGPGDSVRVCTHAIGWWTVAFWNFGKRFCADVPACAGCRRRLDRQKWLHRAITWGATFAGVAAGAYLLGPYRGPLKRWLLMGVVLVCLIPLLVWETLFPPAVDLTAYSDTVDYEFRDEGYAREFAALNGARTDRDG